MTDAGWFVLAIASIALLVAIALSFVPALRSAAAYRFARSVGLNLPPELESSVSARLTRRLRGGCFGAMVAATAAFATVEFWSDLDEAPLVALFLVGAVFAGYAVGAAAASLRSADHSPDRVRVARARAVGVPDYVAPVELVGARVAVGTGVLVAAVVAGDATTGSPPTGNAGIAILLAVTGVVTLVAFEFVSRRIVRRSQPAGATIELVWEDAIRSSLLRDIVTAPLAFGLYAAIYGAIDLAGTSDGNYTTVAAATAATSMAFLPLLLAGFAVFVTRVLKPQRHFARRLWSAVPAQSGIGN